MPQLIPVIAYGVGTWGVGAATIGGVAFTAVQVGGLLALVAGVGMSPYQADQARKQSAPVADEQESQQ